MKKMRVLVGYASRHGATGEIAARIADRLRLGEVDVELRPFGEGTDTGITGFDAFVLGSCVYMGRWDKEPVAFVRRHRDVLRGRPVWLFSSGPVGSQPAADPADLAELRRMVRVRAHQVFRGALQPERMPFAERLLTKAMRVSGDSRDWAAIEAWADGIRKEITTGLSVSGS